MRLARRLAPLLLLAVLAAGCGSSGSEEGTGPGPDRTDAGPGAASAPAGASARSCPTGAAPIEGLRVTGTGCGAGLAIAVAWSREGACSSPPDASRTSCSIRGYRCLGTAAARGVSVSCARPQRSIAFIAERR